MPLLVGCKNKEKFEEFTEAQREFIPSFGMGVMCMTTGVGSIGDGQYQTSIEEAYRRFSLYDRIHSNQDAEGYWPITFEFVKKLSEADFTCNAARKSAEECDHALAYMALRQANNSLRDETNEHLKMEKIFAEDENYNESLHEELYGETKIERLNRIKEIHKYDSITMLYYHDIQELKRTAKYVIDTWLGTSTIYQIEETMDGLVADMIDNMSLYEQYHWDEKTYKYSLKVEENLTNPL
tara:strand:+ start:15916 stop:16632 length:717 start_codon:yes stop_codon:yes gene_type:complete